MNRILLAAAAALVSATAAAKLEPAGLFNHNLVLQRDREAAVFGRAESGAEVRVSFAGAEKSAKAGADGRWLVKLPAMAASAEPRDLVIASGDEKFVCTNVVVGEVWLCSGQSNMQFGMWGGGTIGQHNGWERNGYYDIALNNEPEIRGVYIPQKWSGVPSDIPKRQWHSFTSTPDAKDNPTRHFSAAAYHFAITLHNALRVPVGVIMSYWGGVPIEPFIPTEEFLANPRYRELGERDVAAPPSEAELAQQKRNGWKEPRCHVRPRVLYNAMIAGLVPYGIRGAIWYQGEANRARWNQYYDMLVMLRHGWGEKFGVKDMPFFVAQITPYAYTPEEKDAGLYPIREEMERFGVENGPYAGTINLSDIGMADCIHPFAKRTVGIRFAAMALNRVYGFRNLKCDAPRFREAKLSADGRTVEVAFHDVEKWWHCGRTPLKFELAGAEGDYVLVKAEPQKDRPVVILTVPEGMRPKRLAYLRKESWESLLKNEAGLPLGPFRTELP